MRSTRMLAAAVGLSMALVAQPALGAPDEPHIDDGCGDPGLWVEVDDERHGVDPARPDRVDIDTVTFVDTDDGVDVRLQVCDEVGDPGFTLPTYTVSWWLTDECSGRVHLWTITHVGPRTPDWTARFTRQCETEGWSAAGVTVTGSEIQATVDLDGHLSVDGDTIIWHLDAGHLPEAEAVMLEPGSVWSAPTASAQEGLGWFGSGSAPFAGLRYNLGVWGDSAGPGHDFTVRPDETP